MRAANKAALISCIEEQTWRIRVGPYRVVYDIYDDRALVVILKIARRSEATSQAATALRAQSGKESEVRSRS